MWAWSPRKNIIRQFLTADENDSLVSIDGSWKQPKSEVMLSLSKHPALRLGKILIEKEGVIEILPETFIPPVVPSWGRLWSVSRRVKIFPLILLEAISF